LKLKAVNDGNSGGTMKIKDQTIKELENLAAAELHIVYDLVKSMKEKEKKAAIVRRGTPYKKVRQLLAGCKGSLGNDIITARQDRI
jgi:hypothetical protein